ncbi:MAG: L-2-amino-thiazoline-4-carboxylic acid hydrolase [Clostridiales bacterium]|nr:L-2-amino-thiazoline-4-carboxylic acid hydrolase [Clostridiales bacterium]
MDIDLKKHVMYSPLMEKIVREHLEKKYPKEKRELMWKKVQDQYADFLRDLPYLGGKKNTHNGTGGTYDCIMIFAYYEALDHAPDMDELYDMNCEAFLTGFKGLQGIANANRGYVRRILDLAFRSTAKSKYNCDPRQPTGYIMKVEPYDKEKGPRYIFERCPIAEFAKEHGYLDIMPAFCNSDYPAMDMIHAHLIRRYTCANADICDYRIVGDESEEAKAHPRKTDEKGYWYND